MAVFRIVRTLPILLHEVLDLLMQPNRHVETFWLEHSLRLRFLGVCTLVLMLTGWVAWFYPFDDLVDRSGTPLGGDFIMLYVAGRAVADGEVATIYHDAVNQQRTLEVCPALDPTSIWPFRYPPITALAASLFARFPFAIAFSVFFGLSACCLWRSLVALAERFQLPRGVLRTSCFVAIVGWPVSVETLIGGQTTMLALAMLVGFLILFSRDRYELAGAVLALAMYKPNILALFGLGMVLVKPRLLVGLVPVGLVGLALSWWTVGTGGLREYAALSGSLASASWQVETPFWKVHGIAPWLDFVAPGHGRGLSLGLGILLVVCVAWRQRSRPAPGGLYMSSLLITNSLFNPYVPIYDMVLLLPACFMLMREVHVACRPTESQGRMLLGAAFLLFLGPHLSQMLCKTTGLQFFPILLVLFLFALVRLMFRPGRAPSGRAPSLLYANKPEGLAQP